MKFIVRYRLASFGPTFREVEADSAAEAEGAVIADTDPKWGPPTIYSVKELPPPPPPVGVFSVSQEGNRVTYTLTTADPVSGEVRIDTETYQITENPAEKKYKHSAAQVYGDGFVSSDFSYSISDLGRFATEREEKMQGEARRWIAGLAYQREVEAATTIYVERVLPALLKRGFDTDDDRLLFQAFAQIPEKYPERVENLALLVGKEYKTDGAFRKAIRELLTAGKENAREEYPEAYREEEDKADFYEEYLTQVTKGIVNAL